MLSEKEKYEKLWALAPYRDLSPGLLALPDFLSYFDPKPEESLIDFGCGAGLTALPLLERGLRVSLVDIAENSLAETIRTLLLLRPEALTFHVAPFWELSDTLESADWIYCVDVLEHLPESYVDESLQAMASRMKKGGLLQMTLKSDEMGKMIGETLHLTVKPLSWWEEKISKFWKISKIVPVIEDVQYGLLVIPC